ncbi:hypothetical protein KCV02_g18630, partial [Aureobasidium melanogenum]
YDADYRSSLKDWNSFVESLTEELTKIDDTIPELPLKDVISMSRSFAFTETYDSVKILRLTNHIFPPPGAERAAKDHMLPTMFKLVRTTALLVGATGLQMQGPWQLFALPSTRIRSG